jgi:hypothetical protein
VPGVRREITVLPRLAATLPLPILDPQFVGQPSARYPWPLASQNMQRLTGGLRSCGNALPDSVGRWQLEAAEDLVHPSAAYS